MKPRALIQSHGRLEKRRSDRPESGKNLFFFLFADVTTSLQGRGGNEGWVTSIGVGAGWDSCIEVNGAGTVK